MRSCHVSGQQSDELIRVAVYRQAVRTGCERMRVESVSEQRLVSQRAQRVPLSVSARLHGRPVWGETGARTGEAQLTQRTPSNHHPSSSTPVDCNNTHLAIYTCIIIMLVALLHLLLYIYTSLNKQYSDKRIVQIIKEPCCSMVGLITK